MMIDIPVLYVIISSVNLDPISGLKFNAPSRTFLWNRPPTLNGISVYYIIQLNYSNGTSIYNADTSIQNYTLPMNVDKCSPLKFAVVAKADCLVSNVTTWIGPSHGMIVIIVFLHNNISFYNYLLFQFQESTSSVNSHLIKLKSRMEMFHY